MNKPREKSSSESQPQTASGDPTREEIEWRAHEIYLERGGTRGRDVEDWLKAEHELLEKYTKMGLKAKPAAA